MPYTEPGRHDVHVNSPLTNISIAFTQSADNFIAERVFPRVPVAKQSDAYFTYERGDFNRDDMEERKPGTESAGGGYDQATETYYARVYAYHKDIADQVRGNADSPLDMDRDATVFVTTKGLIRRERSWAANYFPATHAPGGIWTFDVDGAATETAPASFDPTNGSNNDKVFWNDASSTPIEDIRQGKRFVLESTGFEPNKIVLGRPVWDALADHPDIVGRIDRGQTAGPAIAQREAVAALFELDEVLVMNAVHNTAKKGQTASHSFIGGKNALLHYAPDAPGILVPSAGYTFSWTGFAGSVAEGQEISRFRMPALKSDRVEIETAWDQKKVAADLGYYFGSIVQ